MSNEQKIYLKAQQFELTEYHIYSKLAKLTKNKNSKKIMKELGAASLVHYRYWKKTTGKDTEENKLKIFWYIFLARFFGLTFSMKLMEKSEEKAQAIYKQISKMSKKHQWLFKQELEHEKKTLRLINEEFLKYVGSIVLGLNDALVELTGALAGFTITLQNNQLIGTIGLITGIAAALSMAAAEYLSTKSEKGIKSPGKSALYTGVTYIITVAFLIFPYFLSGNYLLSLAWALGNATLVIIVISYYISVVQEASFWKRMVQNLVLSFGVAALTFGIGYLVRIFLHVDI